MNYSLNKEKQELLQKQSETDKKLEAFIEQQNLQSTAFRKEVMKFLQELREELLSSKKKSDAERKTLKEKRVKALQHLKGE